MDSLITIERPMPHVIELHMHDEAGKNALGFEFAALLLQRIAEIGHDTTAKVCIVRGLPEVFCAGGSKDMLRAVSTGEYEPNDILVSRAVLEIPIPTIAAIEGHAVGGGFTLGMCCDVLMLAERSRYGLSFMNMGFTPGMGTTRLIQAAVGEHIAAEMMFSGQYFRGSHFAGRGSINYVLPRGEILPKAREIAERIAQKPRLSLTLLKRSLSLPRRLAFEQARTAESMMHEISFASPEVRKMVEDNYEGS